MIRGVGMIVACLPLIALGAANCLADQLAWTPWLAQLLVGTLLTCGALLLTILGVYRLRYSLTAFSITSSELTKNVSWLKPTNSRSKNYLRNSKVKGKGRKYVTNNFKSIERPDRLRHSRIAEHPTCVKQMWTLHKYGDLCAPLPKSIASNILRS